MTTRNWYSITARAGEAAVVLYDEIGAYGVTAKNFIAALKPHANQPVRLLVNSPGGSVFDAVAIYNALRNHPRKVTAVIEGLAASAASVVVMAAAEIRAAGNSFLMMHNPHGLCLGGADDMRKMADLLDRVKAPLVAAYRRSGKSDAAIEAQNISKSAMAKRMHTSRAQVDRLLDPDNPSVTLNTLDHAARAVGRRVHLELV